MKTKEWINRQSRDLYVKKAQKNGFVSRSAYKLIEIEKKFKVIKSSNVILELGSSPGGWTQVILNSKNYDNYKLICIDKIDPKISLKNNIIFIKEDFNKKIGIIDKIKKIYKYRFDLILSDMAPNSTGHNKTDHLKIMQMADDIVEFISEFLNNDGKLVIKILQGSGEKDLIFRLKKIFNSVNYFKPKSSRNKSPEL